MSRPKPNPQTVMKWKEGKIYISIREGRSSQGLEFSGHKKDAQSIEHCGKSDKLIQQHIILSWTNVIDVNRSVSTNFKL